MDKNTILRAFNTLFFQFMDEVIDMNPEQLDILQARVFFQTMKKNNPTLLIKVWKKNVYEPFQQQIDEENIDFFLNRDYQVEVSKIVGNEQAIHSFIVKMKSQLVQMDMTCKLKIMNDIKNLCHLSRIYCGGGSGGGGGGL